MSVIDRNNGMPAYVEVANLEHDLALLHERYANMRVNAQRMWLTFKYGGAATLAIAFGLLLYSIATNDGDSFAKFFLLTMLLVASGLTAWFCKDMGWGFTYDGPHGFRYPFRSDEEFFTHAIAVREKRLKELKAQS
ncbi:MAG: hypothetical protein EXQ88_08225 [Alphaproteobacteria bacterium]|nr:hypothetical protein [Alphaproteobacteria bacterium]